MLRGELARKVWWERIERAEARHGREYADACHRFPRQVHGQPTAWLDGGPTTDVEAVAGAEFRECLGEISGPGPYPSDDREPKDRGASL